ncbi:MAG: hypothetical protein SGBAC_008097 [Bacillariaceae sp.]
MNDFAISEQTPMGFSKPQQPLDDSLMSLLYLPSHMKEPSLGPRSGAYQPQSFDDPFDDPEMEPVPLSPGIVDNGYCLQAQASPSMQPMGVSSLESLMTLQSNGVHHRMESASATKADPIQILSSTLDPVLDIAAGNKRSFGNSSHQPLLQDQHVVEPFEANKRQKLCRQLESADEESIARFRPYQENQWLIQFKKLIDFKMRTGHCCVPHSFPEDPVLARWVKRQRYQYKKLNENDPTSTMTTHRIEELEAVGFVWHSHAAAWLEKLNELKTFKESTGHCNVPSHFPANVQLSTWVKCQRRQYKLYISGASSNMTIQRFQSLERLGFVFDIRKKGARKSTR